MQLTLQLLTPQVHKSLLTEPSFLSQSSMLLQLLPMKLQLQLSMKLNKQLIKLLSMPMGMPVMIKQLLMLLIQTKMLLSSQLLTPQVKIKLQLLIP
jgi:hypothetical protein